MASTQDAKIVHEAEAIRGGQAKGGTDSAATRVIIATNVTIGTITEAKSGARDDIGSSTDKDGVQEDSRPFIYRDFSQIPEEDFDVDYEIDQEGLLLVSVDFPPFFQFVVSWLTPKSPSSCEGSGRINSHSCSSSHAADCCAVIIHAS